MTFRSKPRDRPFASQALIDFGPKSAPEVKRLSNNSDPAVRDEARRILDAIAPGSR